MVEEYRKRYKTDAFEYLRVVWKEEKRVNRVHQLCIFLCCVGFKGTELYAVKWWVKFITEGPDTAYLPIDNPLIENSNNTEVTLEG